MTDTYSISSFPRTRESPAAAGLPRLIEMLRNMQPFSPYIRRVELFKAVFGDFFVNGDRIFPVEAGKTEVLFGDMGGLFQVVDIQVTKAV